MIRRLRYEVEPQFQGYTIEKYLKLKNYSHGCIVYLKKTEEGIQKNGVWAYTKEKLSAGDILETVFIEEDSSETIVAVEMPLDILYEDEDILVVNKPSDTPIHPSQGNYDNSLANGVKYYYEQQGINFVFRCINRLDRDTTGLVVIAKNMLSGAALNLAMVNREIHRTYLAVVKGKLPENGTIDFPIARKDGSTVERCVDFETGEHAVTHFECLEQNEKYSLSLEGEQIAQERLNNKIFKDIDILYSSNYVRTIQTAKYLANEKNLEINIVSDLGERIFGISSWDNSLKIMKKDNF